MSRYIVFRFVDEGETARALLLEDQAPHTCQTIWNILPLTGDGVHGNYSGTTVGLLFDPTITIQEENSTTCIQTDDVLFTHYEPGVRHGYPDPVSEIYWAYDRYCRPIVPGQWVPAVANVFGRMIGDTSRFYDVCRRVPKEGWKRLEITRAEE